MPILEQVKLDLGIKHSKKDSDIQAAIAACFADLRIAGVDNTAETDPLIIAAVKFYCRAFFNYQGDAERYDNAYTKLKQALSLAGDYRGA